jgi:hypothetical protein
VKPELSDTEKILARAVQDAKASGFCWDWIDRAERHFYAVHELICVDLPSYMGNPQEWLSARCGLCSELVPFGQGRRLGTRSELAHEACMVRNEAQALGEARAALRRKP